MNSECHRHNSSIQILRNAEYIMNKLHTLTCSSRLIWQANRVTVGRADGNSTACQREFQLGRVLSSRESLRFLGFNWAWRTSLPQTDYEAKRRQWNGQRYKLHFMRWQRIVTSGVFPKLFGESYERLHESHLIRSPTLVGKQQACGRRLWYCWEPVVEAFSRGLWLKPQQRSPLSLKRIAG